VAVTGVLDTNIVLYMLGGRLAQPLPAGAYAISVITEMELLSYAGLKPAEDAVIEEFLAGVKLIELDATVRAIAVGLRREYRLKLPDAIVGASAVSLGIELLTNDEKLAKTSGVRCRSLPLK
jgi:predicted nucleic acid-binding protein